MTEEIKHDGSETPSNQKPAPKKNGVALYLVVLFAAAFLMLLLAYFMQQRTNEETIGSLTESITSIESLNNVLNENRQLREELEQLETTLAQQNEQLEALEEQTQTMQATIASWDTFYQVDSLYRAKDYSDCAEKIQSLYAAGAVSIPLPAVERFEDIERALNKKGYTTQP